MKKELLDFILALRGNGAAEVTIIDGEGMRVDCKFFEALPPPIPNAKPANEIERETEEDKLLNWSAAT